jgi:hypothetical protein
VVLLTLYLSKDDGGSSDGSSGSVDGGTAISSGGTAGTMTNSPTSPDSSTNTPVIATQAHLVGALMHYAASGSKNKKLKDHIIHHAKRLNATHLLPHNFNNETTKSECCPEESFEKQAPCWDGYVQRGMKPGKNGKPVPNCVPAAKALDLWEDSDDVVYETDSMSKADGYSPPAGARSAARRAIKFKEEGKANGAGTAVGWTRAGQLARGETISLSTVKRMYSYFSRHEVDKKGKDWGNTANPSNGYIMWLAWGGDAGFSWSRSIVNREADKMIFANFGKEITPIVRSNNVEIFHQPEN